MHYALQLNLEVDYGEVLLHGFMVSDVLLRLTDNPTFEYISLSNSILCCIFFTATNVKN